MVKVGDYIKITSDNPNYRAYVGRGKYYRVTNIARAYGNGPGKSRAYDSGLDGEALVDCYNLPVALYEYEFQVVKNPNKR